MGKGARRRIVQRLGVNLLVLFVDEHQSVPAQAETAPAIFVDTAAYTEAVGGQAACLVMMPVPNAASVVGRPKLDPEQAGVTDLEFGEIGAGGDSLGGGELSLGR